MEVKGYKDLESKEKYAKQIKKTFSESGLKCVVLSTLVLLLLSIFDTFGPGALFSIPDDISGFMKKATCAFFLIGAGCFLWSLVIKENGS